MLYLYCALKQLGSYRGFPVEIEADGVSHGRRDLLMLVLANGRIFGGGFKIAPGADLGDGRLDVSSFGNAGLPGPRWACWCACCEARTAALRRSRASAGGRFRLRFDRPPAYETDGEWNQAAERRPRDRDAARARCACWCRRGGLRAHGACCARCGAPSRSCCVVFYLVVLRGPLCMYLWLRPASLLRPRASARTSRAT